MINYLNINHNKTLLSVGKNDGFCIIFIRK